MTLRDKRSTYPERSEYEKWMFYIKQGGTAGIFDPVPAFQQGWGFLFSERIPKTSHKPKKEVNRNG